MKKSLLVGCGNSRVKKVFVDGQAAWVGQLTTLDINPNCGADVIVDMGLHSSRLPFPNEEFDEIGAYDVLEHWGAQGDFRRWFDEMAEYHRILKPGGTMGIIVPIGADALADPGHTRFFGSNHFWMLNQQWYSAQLAKGMQVSDYRWYWRDNFAIDLLDNIGGHHLAVMLRKA